MGGEKLIEAKRQRASNQVLTTWNRGGRSSPTEWACKGYHQTRAGIQMSHRDPLEEASLRQLAELASFHSHTPCDASKGKSKWQQIDGIIKSGTHDIQQKPTGVVEPLSWGSWLSFVFVNEISRFPLHYGKKKPSSRLEIVHLLVVLKATKFQYSQRFAVFPFLLPS